MTAARPTIDEVIAAIPAWAGRTVVHAPVSGGLTNTNHRVVVDGVPYFVRIPGPSTELLAVDRANERHNTLAAATTGVSPRVAAVVEAWDVFALEWVDAETMSGETLRAPGMPERIAATLRRLHAGPRFRDDFDMFRLTERYLALVDERGIAIPAGYRERLPGDPAHRGGAGRAPDRRRSRATTTCSPRTTSTTASGCGSSTTSTAATTTRRSSSGTRARSSATTTPRSASCARPTSARRRRALLARMRLQMIMSDVGWTLWAAIQARISPIDYDFTGWAEERWARASAAIDGPEFEAWLARRSRPEGQPRIRSPVGRRGRPRRSRPRSARRTRRPPARCPPRAIAGT